MRRWKWPVMIGMALVASAVVAIALFSFRHADSGITSCTQKDQKARYRCWRETVSADVAAGDLTRALRQLAAFTRESPDFVTTCHTFAHSVGERAYKDFVEGRAVIPSSEMQICDFGYYHGFMTAFLSESRDFKQIGAFCVSMDRAPINGIRVDSRAACFHGIGHGSVVDRDPAEWDDPRAVLAQALSTCHAATRDAKDLHNCLDGAYNGMAYGEYIKHVDRRDPLQICRTITDADLPIVCYANLAAMVFNMTPHQTIREAIDLFSRYTDHDNLTHAIPTFANMAARQTGSEAASVATCLSLSGEQKQLCISGYVTGLIQSQPVETKQATAYDLCSGDLLPRPEHESCFEYAFDTLSFFWTEERIRASCIDAKDSDSCSAAAAVRSARRLKAGPPHDLRADLSSGCIPANARLFTWDPRGIGACTAGHAPWWSVSRYVNTAS